MIDSDAFPQPSQNCSGRPALTVTLSRPQPETTVCSVTGAVDWNTRPVLRKALTEARQDDNAHLVIDLSAVTSMDSAGPYTLLEARVKHHLHGGGHLAVITNPTATTIPELHGVAIRAAFDVHPHPGRRARRLRPRPDPDQPPTTGIDHARRLSLQRLSAVLDQQPFQHVPGQLGFGGELDLLADSGLGAPVAVISPGPRQVQLAVDQCPASGGVIGQKHAELAVLDSPGGARILALYPGGLVAL
jgi:anti-anti-sigma factor